MPPAGAGLAHRGPSSGGATPQQGERLLVPTQHGQVSVLTLTEEAGRKRVTPFP